MATEILVNDGGAPARILPFVAASGGLSAGDCLGINSSGEAFKQDKNNYGLAGVALTDADAGALVNVISGSGVIVMANCQADEPTGDVLMVDESNAGKLITYADTDADNCEAVALVLESPAAAGLTKVLLL
jgi:hypothetical protein|tara:strand:- start:1103 stop:1495 length:393 start_codon:yes stop_codon:yes gene_type:complete